MPATNIVNKTRRSTAPSSSQHLSRNVTPIELRVIEVCERNHDTSLHLRSCAGWFLERAAFRDWQITFRTHRGMSSVFVCVCVCVRFSLRLCAVQISISLVRPSRRLLLNCCGLQIMIGQQFESHGRSQAMLLACLNTLRKVANISQPMNHRFWIEPFWSILQIICLLLAQAVATNRKPCFTPAPRFKDPKVICKRTCNVAGNSHFFSIRLTEQRWAMSIHRAIARVSPSMGISPTLVRYNKECKKDYLCKPNRQHLSAW